MKAGDVFENPVTGERAVIRIGTEQTDGELLVADLYIRPGGAVMGEHRHPAIEERFTVLHGRVGFRLSGRTSTAEPGGAGKARLAEMYAQGAELLGGDLETKAIVAEIVSQSPRGTNGNCNEGEMP